jgi:DNA-binding CsgD family transcriptional regulator
MPTLEHQLSPRELEILALVAAGETDRDIARQLFIAPATVYSHLERIRDKTGARRRAQLTRHYLERKKQ